MARININFNLVVDNKEQIPQLNADIFRLYELLKATIEVHAHRGFHITDSSCQSVGSEVKPRTGDKVCHCGLPESAHCIGGGAEHDFRENPVEYPSPISVNLACPECGAPHIDEGEWATRPHKTHQCQSCKHEWRPFEYPTVGVDPEVKPRTGEGP